MTTAIARLEEEPVSGPFVSPLRDLKHYLGEWVSGHYLLTKINACQTSQGRPFQSLRLDDATGSVSGFSWNRINVWRLPLPVSCLLTPIIRNGQLVANVRQVEVLSSCAVENGTALLPRSQCPPLAVGALDSLVAFVESVEPIALRHFLSAVFLDHRIGIPFIKCKGSQKHHHSFPGGLLVHSAGALENVRAMAEMALKDKHDINLAVTGYLLHDLGKIHTVGSESIRPGTGALIRHEMFTLELLAPYLPLLERSWPEGATGLRYILDTCSQSQEVQRQALFSAAEVVKYADRLSASSHNGRSLAHMMRTESRRRLGRD